MNLLRGSMATPETKQCTLCKQCLPRGSFYASPKRKDGLYPWCRSCSVKKTREYNARKPGWKEEKRAYDRARIEANRDRLSKQWRENYLRNRDRQLATAKRWSERNPDKRRAISQSYKHRRRSVERAGMSGKELLEWKSAQPKVCHWCGAACARGYVVDHIRPLAKGGKHEARNLAISCRPCNASKSARDPIEFAREKGKLL
jgi:5-methylcytosine-specific restriction endonuclease McrA